MNLDLSELVKCFNSLTGFNFSVQQLASRYYGEKDYNLPKNFVNKRNRSFGAELSRLVRVNNRYDLGNGYEIVRTIDNKRAFKEYVATNDNQTVAGIKEIKEYLYSHPNEKLSLSVLPTYKNNPNITYSLVKKEV